MAMYQPIGGSNVEGGEDLELGIDDDKPNGVENVSMSLVQSCSLNTKQQQQHGLGQKQQRLVSLDIFRGLTVVLMVFVDYAGGILPAINHSPWNGVTLADFVFPFFLFIVGVSLAFTYKNVQSKIFATQKAVLRVLKLFILGVFLQGGFIHGIHSLTYGIDVEKIRWMGILQRIAIAYLVGAVCEIWLKDNENVSKKLSVLTKYCFQWAVVLVITAIYLSLLYGLYVPDWEYRIPADGSLSQTWTFSVKCGVRGDTGPACNAVGMIDRMVLRVNHLYQRPVYARTELCSINYPDYGPLPTDAPSWCQAPFDPEGILSSAMAIVACLIGLHFGHIIIEFKDHRDRVFHWAIPSTLLVISGLALDLFGMHINKALYTLSYMCITSGAAGFLLAGIYLLVDVYGYRRGALVFEWMGKHALTIYVLAACNLLPVVLHGFYWKQPQNNIVLVVHILCYILFLSSQSITRILFPAYVDRNREMNQHEEEPPDIVPANRATGSTSYSNYSNIFNNA